MTEQPANGGTLAYRVQQVERDVQRIYETKASLRDLDALSKEVGVCSSEVKSLRRTIMAFAFTIAGSAIAIAFAVLQGSGHS